MADRQRTVRDLTEALKRFPEDAKIYYEMGPNGPGTVGRAQYIKAWGGDSEMSVVLDR
jgi:ABC-type Fe3+-hydroxamate transport system substrate-binding protein